MELGEKLYVYEFDLADMRWGMTEAEVEDVSPLGKISLRETGTGAEMVHVYWEHVGKAAPLTDKFVRVVLRKEDDREAMELMLDYFDEKRKKHEKAVEEIEEKTSEVALWILDLDKKGSDVFDESEWFERARIEGAGDPAAFESKCLGGYEHDYSTVVSAATACIMAYAHKLSWDLGLTGFQASYIPLIFLREWNGKGKKVGFKVLDYDYMLYPQYEDVFEKKLDATTWENLRTAAEKLLAESGTVNGKVLGHWKGIVDGNVPFGYEVESRTNGGD